MAPPHRNDPHYLSPPHPDDGEELTVEFGGGLPSVLAVARGRLVDDGAAIKKLKGIREI